MYVELLDSGYGWVDPETGVEYATDDEAYESRNADD